MQGVTGRHWTGRWWGGPLADGTVIVTNPINPSTSIVDLTATSTTSDQMYRPESEDKSFSDWWFGRMDSFRLPLGLPIAPMRGSIVLASAGIILTASVFFLLGTPYWATVFFVLLASLLAVALLVGNEWRKIKPLELQAIPEEDRSPLAPVRYVDKAVSDTEEWERIACSADRVGPESPVTQEVHRILWHAAGVRAYADLDQVGPEEFEELEALAVLSETLASTS